MIDFFKNLLEQIEKHGKSWNLPHWLLSNLMVVLSLIISFLSIVAIIYKTFLFFWKLKKNRALDKDLHPFYTSLSANELRRFYIKTRLLTFTPSNFLELIEVIKVLNKKNTLSFKKFYKNLFSKRNPDRFYFILGESGLGKTTFLMNLFTKYNQKLNKPYKVKLIPLGHPHTFEEINKLIPVAKETILLIDGFDELNLNSDGAKNLKEVFDMIWSFRIVVITCRTQFFESKESEPLLTNLPKSESTGFIEYKRYYISPFTEFEVRKYLRKKYSVFHLANRKKAYKIVISAINLMVRPFLLKNIEYLINDSAKIAEYKYSLAIYELLIKNWIERDIQKIASEAIRKTYELNAISVLKELARKSFEKGLFENSYYLTLLEVNELSNKYSINLEFTKVRSLLNRDDKGNIKFSHKSVLEYFIALEAVSNPVVKGNIETNRSFDVARTFLDEYYFINRITPLINNCEGFYFDVNNKDKLPFTNLNIMSMYTASALYFKTFIVNDSMNAVFNFKRVREIVFYLGTSKIKMLDIYFIVYCYWLEFMNALNMMFDILYKKKVKIETEWLNLYKKLYSLNIKNMVSINLFNQTKHLKHTSSIEDMLLLQCKANITNVSFKFDYTNSDHDITVILKKLYNNKLTDIVSLASKLTTNKLVTFLEGKTNITDYANRTEQEKDDLNKVVKKLGHQSEADYLELNSLIQQFNTSSFSFDSIIKIYY